MRYKLKEIRGKYDVFIKGNNTQMRKSFVVLSLVYYNVAEVSFVNKFNELA